MYEILKNNLQGYLQFTGAIGLICLSIIYVVFNRTKEVKNKKIKNSLRLSISLFLLCLWFYWLVYLLLYPIALANYEYKYDLTEEKIGVLSNIEITRNDRSCLIVGETEYEIVGTGRDPGFRFGRDFKEGDTVKIVYGRKSMYIFEIYEVEPEP